MIFVFGSNLSGIHGAGAALYAMNHFGAKWGVGRGISGQSYAIPTKDANIRTRRLEDVAEDVTAFIMYAKNHPEEVFAVTEIGTGLAGFTHDQIAPLFKFAPPNCVLSVRWRHLLDRTYEAEYREAMRIVDYT